MPALLLRRGRLAPITRPADVGGGGAAVYIGLLSMALRIVSHARHTHSCTSYASNITHHTSHITLSPAIHRPTLTLPACPVLRSHHTITQPCNTPLQHSTCVVYLAFKSILVSFKLSCIDRRAAAALLRVAGTIQAVYTNWKGKI